MMWRGLMSMVCVVVAVPASGRRPPGAAIAPDSEIREMLVQRIDIQRQGVGIVVGIVEPAGRRVVAYGRLDTEDPRPLNGDTVFEIGSVTKVFTSLLLADAVQRGDVTLADPVQKYLPESAKMPTRGGREITLQDLATHTSGLPRLPSNMSPKDPANPYADYTVGQLYDFLSGYTLTRDIGAQYEYSNLGGGLLGHVLGRRAGTDYESLLRSRILVPLGMSSTAIALTPALRPRLAVGHNQNLDAVANWDGGALAGAGAVRSTVNDMLTFVAANLGYVQSPLAPAMADMRATRRPTGALPQTDVALGWHITTRGDLEIVWHNGGTGGYRSFVGFNPRARAGVVVLSNTSTRVGVDDIGMHLLDPTVPLAVLRAPTVHREIAVEPEVFDRYVGRYAFSPEVFLTITREAGHFFLQLTGQPRAELFAESERDYFLKVVDAQISFEIDADGRVTAAVLHQAGRDQRATRVP